MQVNNVEKMPSNTKVTVLQGLVTQGMGSFYMKIIRPGIIFDISTSLYILFYYMQLVFTTKAPCTCMYTFFLHNLCYNNLYRVYSVHEWLIEVRVLTVTGWLYRVPVAIFSALNYFARCSIRKAVAIAVMANIPKAVDEDNS